MEFDDIYVAEGCNGSTNTLTVPEDVTLYIPAPAYLHIDGIRYYSGIYSVNAGSEIYFTIYGSFGTKSGTITIREDNSSGRILSESSYYVSSSSIFCELPPSPPPI